MEELKRKVFQFRTAKGDPIMNVALVGGVGAGKSSLISTVASAECGYISRCAPHGAGTKSLTSKFKKYVFGKRGAEAPFHLYDTMGWSSDDWKPEDLSLMSMGYVPNGTDMSRGIRGVERMRKLRSDPTVDDRMHCIVFVVPCECVGNEAYMEHLNTLKDEVFCSDMQPMVVLTKIDEINADMNILEIMASSDLKRLKKELFVLSGVPMNCILPVKNFESEMSVEPEVAVFALKAMYEILNTAATNYRMMSEQ
ncbi:unnamed protein product [Ostreobium quekettii]|uniref:Interferon-induced protein 44-like n=1 Tax=Ostreobium quekettii TaxID=121088 RepID=A0A8S1J781_9CHLO|nr:unnamed protein product [Ostreobium quekettii]|eukprot:evm.model.scf_2224.1 EVM.evm.TU.scf_2224.1   scf_2224:2621-4848(+)